MPTRYFTPATYRFLKDLEANNNRPWFHEHKDRYDHDIKEPALQFILDMAPRLAKISPHFEANARAVGGSLFRIQRDTRFGKDKTPYKTNTGIQFRHAMGKDAHAPGYYMHLEPSGSFMGLGLWRPESKVAYQIREAIADNPAAWKRATRSKRFTDVVTLQGDSLIRPPRGYEADHPLIEDLKLKDFIASARLSQKQVTSPTFIDEYEAMLKAGTPFMRFLCGAVGVPF